MKINNIMKKVSIILILLVMVIGIFETTYATQSIANMYTGNVSDSETGQGISEVRKIIGRIITIVQVFGIFIAVAVLMALGIKYMYASPGDKAQIKQHLTVYVIGAVVMFGSAGILQIIKDFVVKI